MARVLAAPGLSRTTLARARAWWSSPGAWTTPDDVPVDGGLPMALPGTLGAALRDAGRSGEVADLDHVDAWFRIALPGGDAARVVLHGVATGCEIWIDGRSAPGTATALRPHHLELPAGARELVLACRALTPRLAGRHPRPRWKTQLVASSALRLARTPLLGRMPGWSSGPAPVGPFRPIVVERGPRTWARVRACLRGDDGVVAIELDGDVTAGALRVGGVAAALERRGSRWCAEVVVPRAPRWWPHTHGEPALHEVVVEQPGGEIALGPVGFREVTATSAPGLRLAINGVPVFCRGGNWLPVDAAALGGDPAVVRAEVERLRDAGANLVRLPGTGCYEDDAFFDACDQLGVMVWQDALLANLDYPTDEAFRAELAAELDARLDRVEASPSLVVVCGGSEIEQQATMFGLAPASLSWPLLDDVVPTAVRARRPDVAYVRNSPTGGALPFHVRDGVAHYFGVGAYQRPLEDARRAEVGFATECLAFAQPPAVGPIDGGVPRDVGAAWDFADVRDHYLRTLYGRDPGRLRAEDPECYAQLSRRVPGEVMAHVFAEWRRAGSVTAGALVWTWRDVAPGAGWGVVGADGRAKPALWYLRRAWAPRALFLLDEGQDGVVAHVVNDRPTPLAATLRVQLLSAASHVVADGAVDVVVPAHGVRAVSIDAVLGAFRDPAYAYRFGPPAHEAVVARLGMPDDVVADAVHFPLGRPAQAPADPGLELTTEAVGDRVIATVRSRALSYPVVVEADGHDADDGYFPVWPGAPRRVELRRRVGGSTPARATARIAT